MTASPLDRPREMNGIELFKKTCSGVAFPEELVLAIMFCPHAQRTHHEERVGFRTASRPSRKERSSAECRGRSLTPAWKRSAQAKDYGKESMRRDKRRLRKIGGPGKNPCPAAVWACSLGSPDTNLPAASRRHIRHFQKPESRLSGRSGSKPLFFRMRTSGLIVLICSMTLRLLRGSQERGVRYRKTILYPAFSR